MKQVVKIFKSLSDPTRLRILLLLFQRDFCVCELSSILGMEQSRISHQLRILRNADLVEDTRDGKWIIYKVPEDKKKDLKFVFDRLLGENLMNSEKFAGDYEKLKASSKISLRIRPVSIERRNI